MTETDPVSERVAELEALVVVLSEAWDFRKYDYAARRPVPGFSYQRHDDESLVIEVELPAPLRALLEELVPDSRNER